MAYDNLKLEKAAIKRLVLWADATTGMVGFIL